ncbi:MAG: hypothetical protein ACRDQF_18550, partial [Thermocrispum sp.]
MKNAGALAVLAAVGATVVLAACSPSLEEASPLPPGTEPDLTIDAPSSNSVAPAEPTDDACTIEDFTVEGESGTRPKITHPGPPCTAPETVLTAELDAGGGVAAKKGDTVSVNYVIVGVTSGKRVTTWTLAKSEPEPVEAGSGGKGWDAEVVGMRPGGRKLV